MSAVSTSPIARLLSRVTGVRNFGDGWRADCPNGHTKARGSLAISEGDDGRILLTCFSCFDTPGIMDALGLSLADLFVNRITHGTTPQERRQLRERDKQLKWEAALDVLTRDAGVVLIAANCLARSEALTNEDAARLALAVERIAQAKKVLHG